MRPLRSDEAAAYLAALVDGEGCIGSYRWAGKNGKPVYHRTVVIGMCDLECIEAAARCFDILGIRYCRFRRPPTWYQKRTVFGINLSSFVSLTRFRDLVPIQHAAKRAKLLAAIASFGDMTCSGCGGQRDARTAGCSRCRDRHKYRRKRVREGHRALTPAPGRTGRHPKGFTYAAAAGS